LLLKLKLSAMLVTMGININDSKERWSELLMSFKKTIETRNTNSLKPYVGKPMGLIRTGRGKAQLVGLIELGEPIVYHTLEEFRADAHRHGIKAGSDFDFQGKKFGYPVRVIKKLAIPVPVNSLGIVARKITPIEI
jgi:hypothetical protein